MNEHIECILGTYILFRKNFQNYFMKLQQSLKFIVMPFCHVEEKDQKVHFEYCN